MRRQIILSHGSESSPEATKVSMLAMLAESLGWRTQRPDYRAADERGYAGSVAPRIARLRATIEALDAPPLLVGSMPHIAGCHCWCWTTIIGWVRASR